MTLETHDDHDRFRVLITGERLPAGAPDLADGRCGAVATFRGVVRARTGSREVVAIDYECYSEMTAREVLRVLREAAARYPLRAAYVAHRTGRVPAGESSVIVVVAAAHRGHAFDALRDIVEALKEQVPVWKKEIYADGTSRWL